MFWKVLSITFIVLTVHFGILLFTRSTGKKFANLAIDEDDDRPKLIIDTDAGGDDAVALLLALAAKDAVQVIGITCSYGNTNESNVESNVLKILTIANRVDIPVYGGVEKPLLRDYTAGDYFGRDGLGDFNFGRPIRGSIDRSMHAAVAMIEITKKYPGAISILTLGPLTNVALAASLDPGFTRNVKRFYTMGSTVSENGSALEVEFNFGQDPESSAAFLKSLTNQKTLVSSWDVTLKRNISKQWRTEVLSKLNSEAINFLNKAEAVVLDRVAEWLPADSIAAAVTIWPEIITSRLEARMSVITCDETYEGAVIVDPKSPAKNVEIVRDFDVAAFQDKLMRYLA